MKTKTWIIILSILLGISFILNLSLLLTIKQVNESWQYSQMLIETEWCEITNVQMEIVNDLLIELQYYDSSYNEIPFMEKTECWG